MRVDVLNERLADAAARLNTVAPRRTALPILHYLKAETIDGRLALTASDLELDVTMFLGAQVHEEGATCLPAKMLKDMTARLPDDRLSIEATNGHAKLSMDGRLLDLDTQDADDFPPVRHATAEAGRCELSDLSERLSRVAFIARRRDSRPALQHVYVEADAPMLTLTATDDFRLASYHLDYAGPAFTCLAPPASLSKAVKLLRQDKNPEDRIRITCEDTSLFLDGPTTSCRIQTNPGDYPDYRQSVPDSHTTRITAVREQLRDEVRTALVLAKDGSGRLRLTATTNELRLHVKAEAVGTYAASVPVSVQGTNNKIALDARYLSDALAAMTGEHVTIDMTTASRPAVLYDNDDGAYVIMPMTLDR